MRIYNFTSNTYSKVSVALSTCATQYMPGSVGVAAQEWLHRWDCVFETLCRQGLWARLKRDRVAWSMKGLPHVLQWAPCYWHECLDFRLTLCNHPTNFLNIYTIHVLSLSQRGDNTLLLLTLSRRSYIHSHRCTFMLHYFLLCFLSPT